MRAETTFSECATSVGRRPPDPTVSLQIRAGPFTSGHLKATYLLGLRAHAGTPREKQVSRAAWFLHLTAMFLNAAFLLQSWPVRDVRILILVGASFFVSAVVIMYFRELLYAHAGATAFHALSIGALLGIPLLTTGAVLLLLIVSSIPFENPDRKPPV